MTSARDKYAADQARVLRERSGRTPAPDAPETPKLSHTADLAPDATREHTRARIGGAVKPSKHQRAALLALAAGYGLRPDPARGMRWQMRRVRTVKPMTEAMPQWVTDTTYLLLQNRGWMKHGDITDAGRAAIGAPRADEGA